MSANNDYSEFYKAFRKILFGGSESDGSKVRYAQNTINGVMRKQNQMPEQDRVCGDNLTKDDVVHSQFRTNQIKNKIIDNP